jgi:hypothetical protein
MRLLCEIFIIGALLYLGWDIPFRQRLPSYITPTKQIAAPRATATAAGTGGVPLQPFVQSTPNYTSAVARPVPSATQSGSWMFDPNHHSALDVPKKSSTPH